MEERLVLVLVELPGAHSGKEPKLCPQASSSYTFPTAAAAASSNKRRQGRTLGEAQLLLLLAAWGAAGRMVADTGASTSG